MRAADAFDWLVFPHVEEQHLFPSATFLNKSEPPSSEILSNLHSKSFYVQAGRKRLDENVILTTGTEDTMEVALVDSFRHSSTFTSSRHLVPLPSGSGTPQAAPSVVSVLLSSKFSRDSEPRQICLHSSSKRQEQIQPNFWGEEPTCTKAQTCCKIK